MAFQLLNDLRGLRESILNQDGRGKDLKLQKRNPVILTYLMLPGSIQEKERYENTVSIIGGKIQKFIYEAVESLKSFPNNKYTNYFQMLVDKDWKTWIETQRIF